MPERTWHKICRIAVRRRVSYAERTEGGTLRRCLNCWDLTSLGVGSTLGIGVYVLVGSVALKTAGPSIVLSFFIAAVTSVFAGLSYAELAARVPLAGSTFVYTYVTVGELIAFIVGWSNLLEFLFGAASVARGLSTYIDAVIDHTLSTWYLAKMPLPAHLNVSAYFDLFAFLFVLALGCILAFGVRESSTVNNVFSAINIIGMIFIVIVGSFKADSSNWNIPQEQVPPGYGSGGFFPYGVWGTLKGAAVCFYGFVGFDVVNFSGEEVKEPRRTIPIAIMCILSIVFAVYAGVSTVATMMIPYYEMAPIATVSKAFTAVGWDWARWIVVVGAIFGITTSLFGSLFPIPRLLYSMAHDGLFIHWFAKVNPNRQSPIVATIVPTIIISLLAAFLQLEQLVLVMCVGTLCSYTIVAMCVVLLRYRSSHEPKVTTSYLRQIIGRGEKTATRTSSRVVAVAICLFICVSVAIAVVVIHTTEPLIPALLLHGVAIPTIIVMALQPTNHDKLAFSTPLVPFIPCLSIYANVHLMVVINLETWLRVLIWLCTGIPIYLICVCCYHQYAVEPPKNKDTKSAPHADTNGKPPVVVQIVVESPTPPRTMARPDSYIDGHDNLDEIHKEVNNKANMKKIEDIIVQQVQIENNAEKEAKIIDLLDQVLQAEEDSYGEILSLKESKDDDSVSNETSIFHRKSLSELSDAGSDASVGSQALSKYDVIAQVHREDLPKVSEEEERLENNNFGDNDNFDAEEITAFNESETNSRTDESGYSDTIDRPALSESVDDIQNSIPVPPPPPLDENFFKTHNFKKFNTVTSRHTQAESQDVENEEEGEPRLSIQSNNSQSDGNMRFGSDRQIKFMSKLNYIFQKSMAPSEDEEEPRKRSNSTGNASDTEFSVSRERPALFMDLKKELLSREAAQNLRPVNTEDKSECESSEPEEVEDKSMSREDLKQKLENIFAVGGPQLIKPRLMKSNPPTPEESYQTDVSSTESISKMPKVDKNDTLKRQKEKFGEVLNSFRLSMNKDDEV